MSFLKNAVDSVILGVEDYQSSDERRLISTARNVVAGILLLFKHHLSELSPAGSDEVLIKQKLSPYFDGGGNLHWKGEGKKTVDVQQIQERFEALRVVVDWKRVRKITDHRNDIEHYFSAEPKAVVRGMIADSFLVIRDFVRDILKKDPLELFGSDTWQVLTDVAEVYEKERKQCLSNIRAIDWHYSELEQAMADVSCPECGSELLDAKSTNGDRATAKLACLSCGEIQDWESLAGTAVTNAFSDLDFRYQRDGGDPLTIECPSCHEETYLLHGDVCMLCEDSIPRNCAICGTTIPWSELDGGSICGYCAHMAQKD